MHPQTIFNQNGWLLILYMVVIMSTALFGVRPQFSRNRNDGLGLFGLAILTFLMSVFPIQCGDFFYYGITFQNGYRLNHFEDFYIWLWNVVDNNYILWRMAVWGGTVLLLILIIKKLKLNHRFAAFIFVITEMFYFGTMRNMLGFMMMFYGLVIVLSTYQQSRMKQLLWIIIGGVCLYFSTFLHRSMNMYIAVLAISIIPFGIRTMKTSLFAFPVLYGSIFFLANIVLTLMSSDIQSHAVSYTEGERSMTIFQTIKELAQTCAYLYLMWIVVKNTTEKDSQLPLIYKVLLRYSYIWMYVGLLFYGQATGGWLSSRFIETGELAFMFVIMYFFFRYPRTRGVKFAFGTLILITIYNILYTSTYASAGFVERIKEIVL